MANNTDLPALPTETAQFVRHLTQNQHVQVRSLLEPYLTYESKLRSLFAQDPTNPLLKDNLVGLAPIFNGDEEEIKVWRRDLDNEPQEEKSKYMMELDEATRKPAGARAIVDFEEFKKNFAIFSEGALHNLDWTGIVAAGSSVLTPLLPVPDKHKATKKDLRTYYHDIIAPTSDVDLFLYGTDDDEVAIKRMESIEATIKDNLLWETTSIRTKNTITIVSQYPNRHIQIVLRLYKSIAEILAGFDVNCACVAYDGSQVYANPRAIASWMLQCNDVDLSRRSPSYEYRLNKYRSRGFEVRYDGLKRDRIDPTIYERNLGRMKGLARLLVLDRLPEEGERENYLNERRTERGRPPKPGSSYHQAKKTLKGDLKAFGSEMPEWEISEEESNYNTVSIPYGKPHHAKRSEKLIYQKDMLLNAEWNKHAQKDRDAYLHRHPAFIGSVSDIVKDCCGYCPEPANDEEREIQEEDDKFFIRGPVTFLKDDPGRQEIGSFNPLTENDWTDMAYIGEGEKLCQSIVARDPQGVRDWLAQEGHDINRRDYTGRTPLQLACLCSTAEIVKILLDAGAKIIGRMVDGRTALHLAAGRGDADICKALLLKSAENEELKDQREERAKAAKAAASSQKAESKKESQKPDDEDEEMDDADEDDDMVDVGDEESVYAKSGTTTSFVEVKKKAQEPEDGALGEEEEEDDDILDINLADWDYQLSPLHYAIIGGHKETVKVLVGEFGADILQPVKTGFDWQAIPRQAILSMNLIVNLPKQEEREQMLRTLLELGASCAQGDPNGVSGFLRIVQMGNLDLLKILFDADKASALAAADHLAKYDGWRSTPYNALIVAIKQEDEAKAAFLLDAGVKHEVAYSDFLRVLEPHEQYTQRDEFARRYHHQFMQPAELALEADMPNLFKKFIELGVDPSAYGANAQPDEPNDNNRNQSYYHRHG